jgi:hypothetical protein
MLLCEAGVEFFVIGQFAGFDVGSGLHLSFSLLGRWVRLPLSN